MSVLNKRNIFNEFVKKVIYEPQFDFLKFKPNNSNNKWKNISRQQLYSNIGNCVERLKDLNVKKGDVIAYKGNNSIEWVSWNLATYSLGAIWVPMYAEQNTKQCEYIIHNCQPKVVIKPDIIDLQDIYINTKKTKLIDNKLETNKNTNLINIEYNDLATLIYTSGTTGNPKGVKLTHENLLSNIDSMRTLFKNRPENITSLNILPWAHIYSLTCELYYNMIYDNSVAISSDKLKFMDECKEIKPEILYLVPKVLETIKYRLNKFDKPIINKSLPFILNYIFGGRLMNIFIGGSKLHESTRDFYSKNKVNVCEGYGCTETSPMVSVNHLFYPRNEQSVGKIMENVDVQIINGEICVNGPNVMNGYWKDDENTNQVFINFNNKKYYKTGDAGKIVNDFLFYKGRISENYKMSNGKFVNVNEIETKLKKYIQTGFIIYGEHMDHNILIVEKPFNKNKLKKMNSNIDSYLKIKEIIELETHVMQQFLTPKMSIQRKKLIKYLNDKKIIVKK